LFCTYAELSENGVDRGRGLLGLLGPFTSGFCPYVQRFHPFRQHFRQVTFSPILLEKYRSFMFIPVPNRFIPNVPFFPKTQLSIKKL
jgi:hypothetical protein